MNSFICRDCGTEVKTWTPLPVGMGARCLGCLRVWAERFGSCQSCHGVLLDGMGLLCEDCPDPEWEEPAPWPETPLTSEEIELVRDDGEEDHSCS